MNFKRRTRLDAEVNLTPLIDVVFLLLICFMVSTTFIKDSHLSIDLPKADAEVTGITSDKIEVTISKAGRYAINDVALLNGSLQTLKSAITKVSGGDNKLPMIITADAATPYQAVVTAMDAAGQLGFVHMSMTTRNGTSEASGDEQSDDEQGDGEQ